MANTALQFTTPVDIAYHNLRGRDNDTIIITIEQTLFQTTEDIGLDLLYFRLLRVNLFQILFYTLLKIV